MVNIENQTSTPDDNLEEEDVIILQFDDGTSENVTVAAGTIKKLQIIADAEGITLEQTLTDAITNFLKPVGEQANPENGKL